jgi:hypothetical protein
MIEAIWMIDQGAKADEAITMMKHFHNAWFNAGMRAFVEDYAEGKLKT